MMSKQRNRPIRREQSPLQQVCMQYGKDCFRLSNSYELAKFLRENGLSVAAYEVEAAIIVAKRAARQNYFNNRKAIQPDWKDWDARRNASLADIDWLGIQK